MYLQPLDLGCDRRRNLAVRGKVLVMFSVATTKVDNFEKSAIEN